MSDHNTEEKILEAARNVFIAKGLDGARMQDIADQAGINKALLHYYFRSKDKLFQKVFLEKGKEMLVILQEVINSEHLTVREKISILIDREFAKLEQDPMMPLFIITEMNRNPERLLLVEELQVGKVHLKKLFKQVKKEIEAGTIRKDIHVEDIILDIMSLMHFPRLSRNLLTEMLFDGDQTAYANTLERRKEHIKYLVLKNLEP